MNDINLIENPDNPNQLDWSFNSYDVDNVTNKRQLISAVKHAVKLMKGELLQILYTEKGNDAITEIIHAQNTSNQLFITESLKVAVEEIEGVSTADVTITDTSSTDTFIDIEIITNNGDVVVISGV